MAKKHRGKLIFNSLVVVLVIALIYLAREDIKNAWLLLGQVNIFILLLLIPVQFLSYYAAGMIFFTYLKSRGQLKKAQTAEAAALALELNFINHVFPSGGISGVTYMIWRLRKIGVGGGQAAMAQIIRVVCILVAFVTVLALSLLFVTADNNASNWLVSMTTVAVTGIVFLVLFAAYLVGGERRIVSFTKWISKLSNKIVQKATFGRKKQVLSDETAVKFALELYEDFLAIKEQKRLLIKPLIWAFVFTLADIALFAVTFLALGVAFSPALIVIAVGAASLVGTVMITPGGAGGYEATMVMVLAAGGMLAADATSGVALTRVVLILGTLASGYIVYHRAMTKYGKPDLNKKIDLLDTVDD
ncbi:MAG: flippase-like domain-containing protein [Candidatus Nomurabacteria bacterium]|jgi:uncharacterized protein (TIRG00374 family)|nr:flippase-like domain-containing protein [Candidatus Nomurabacteria bacterium]